MVVVGRGCGFYSYGDGEIDLVVHTVKLFFFFLNMEAFSALLVLRIELGSSSLAAGSFTHRSVLPPS